MEGLLKYKSLTLVDWNEVGAEVDIVIETGATLEVWDPYEGLDDYSEVTHTNHLNVKVAVRDVVHDELGFATIPW